MYETIQRSAADWKTLDEVLAEHSLYVYVYVIGKSVNILYSIIQNYILYSITQDKTHLAHMGLLA